MKIGIYTPYLDTLTGGEKYILSMASCLSSDHQVCLFWDAVHEAVIKEEAKKKLGIDLASVQFVKNIFSSSVSLPSRLLESRKYDRIIYLSDGSLPLVACDLLIHFQFPVEWIDGKSAKTRFKIKRAKNVICNSVFTKEYIDRKFGITSVVLYPPVEIPKGLLGKKENIILNVGRFGQHIEGAYFKKQDILIDVFRKMVDGGLKKWKLVFAISVSEADMDKLGALREMAAGYPIEFVVNPPNDALWSLYDRAAIYWHASGYGEDLEKHPEKAEHFGISTVEAMGAGVVPIVIRAGGQIEIVEHKKSGYLWSSLEELMAYTFDVIENKDLQEELSIRARKRAGNFIGSRFCEDLKKLI